MLSPKKSDYDGLEVVTLGGITKKKCRVQLEQDVNDGRCRLVCFEHRKISRFAGYSGVARLDCNDLIFLGLGPYWDDLHGYIFTSADLKSFLERL